MKPIFFTSRRLAFSPEAPNSSIVVIYLFSHRSISKSSRKPLSAYRKQQVFAKTCTKELDLVIFGKKKFFRSSCAVICAEWISTLIQLVFVLFCS
jgi:hypothetical protein